MMHVLFATCLPSPLGGRFLPKNSLQKRPFCAHLLPSERSSLRPKFCRSLRTRRVSPPPFLNLSCAHTVDITALHLLLAPCTLPGTHGRIPSNNERCGRRRISGIRGPVQPPASRCRPRRPAGGKSRRQGWVCASSPAGRSKSGTYFPSMFSPCGEPPTCALRER